MRAFIPLVAFLLVASSPAAQAWTQVEAEVMPGWRLCVGTDALGGNVTFWLRPFAGCDTAPFGNCDDLGSCDLFLSCEASDGGSTCGGEGEPIEIISIAEYGLAYGEEIAGFKFCAGVFVSDKGVDAWADTVHECGDVGGLCRYVMMVDICEIIDADAKANAARAAHNA